MYTTRRMIGMTLILGLFAAGALAMTTWAADPKTGLVVHEWGTFSSFSGSDGKLLQFHPENTDLPQFVHRVKYGGKEDISGLISLETPVLYFYADRPMTASVQTSFPGGIFTEWFPQAEQKDSRNVLNWKEVNVRPGTTLRLPGTAGENHYFAARETDAAPLDVPVSIHGTQLERERFLFYRGVGTTLKTPLTVTAVGDRQVSVRASDREPISSLVLIESKAGQLRFRQLDPLAAGESKSSTLPTEAASADSVRAALVTMLTKSGLFEKEARAMVKTWDSAWLGTDGIRVLYVLPTGWTERTIPLSVSPRPDTLTRVMVGRHEFLTPEREREIDSIVRQTKTGSAAERSAASAALAKLGRFAAPARDRAEERMAGRR